MVPDIPGFSHIPANPSFRNAAVNNVVLVPLLSSTSGGSKNETPPQPTSKSAVSFDHLFDLLRNHAKIEKGRDLLYVISNNSLTRPGDWRYNETPLHSFHWEHGCQRIQMFDGRPENPNSQYAHDRLLNSVITKDWIDLIPSRRTAAVIGVLNLHDCCDLNDLHRAEEELQKWAERYATHPYEITTATGSSYTRDVPIQRLFVFDSFDEDCQKIDLSQANTQLLAFPPYDETHSTMMDLHLNVVVNDLAVAIFRSLEEKIQQADKIISAAKDGQRRSLFAKNDEQAPQSKTAGLSLSDMASLVRPGSVLAKSDSPEASEKSEEDTVAGDDAPDEKSLPAISASKKVPQLFTPLDGVYDTSKLSKKDREGFLRRNRGRWQKHAADLALLAGSPLDAYQRYLKAAGVSKSVTPDPLWYAFALLGCAAAHIAMAECGGFNVDEYLESNFQLPDDIMALVKKDPKDDKRPTGVISGHKQTLPEIVFDLCEEASNILGRNPRAAALHAELLISLAFYTSESAEGHLRCRWGEGEGCFAGSVSHPRWEQTSVSKLQFHEFKTKEGNDMILINQFNRVKRTCELLSQAASLGGLDEVTQVDVALTAYRMCCIGVKATEWKKTPETRIPLPRKASFFATIAAELISNLPDVHSSTKSDAWSLVIALYSPNGNSREIVGNYGWATLRATALHALSVQGQSAVCQEASQLLLGLLGRTDTASSTSVFSQFVEMKPDPEVAVEREAPQAPRPRNDLIDVISDDFTETEYDHASDSESVASNANIRERVNDASFATKLREGYASMTTVYPKISQEAKWANDDPVKAYQGPLWDLNELSARTLALNCVWSTVERRRCIAAQKACIERVLSLHRELSMFTVHGLELSLLSSKGQAGLPIYVSSTRAIKLDPAMDLECVKKKTKSEDKGAMSTFYNPFESKRKEGMQVSIRIAEDEEQALHIEFENTLSVPFMVSRCELVFDQQNTDRVQATALSFVIPPKAKKYVVNFPFTILPRSLSAGEEYQSEEFEVKELSLSCLGRSITLPIEITKEKSLLDTCEESKIPRTASEYPHAPSKKSFDPEKLQGRPKFETFPCQPLLEIVQGQNGSPVGQNEEFTVELSDGMRVSLPCFYLSSYGGPSHRGEIRRLQILSVGVQGQSDKILFDTDSNDAPKADLDMFTQSEASSSPLRILSTNEVDLKDMSSRSRKTGSNEVKIQIASSLNFSSKWPRGTSFVIRFRYQGISTGSFEVWRRREVKINIKFKKGPFVNALSVSPALLQESMSHRYNELMNLRHRYRKQEEKKEEEESRSSSFDSCSMLPAGVGPFVSGDDCGFLLAIRNTTTSPITVARLGTPLSDHSKALRIDAGTTATVPLVLSRFGRKDLNLLSAAKSLVSEFAYAWSSVDGSSSGVVLLRETDVLAELERNISLTTHLCEAPCDMKLCCELEGGVVSDDTPVIPGQRLTFRTTFRCRDWVPRQFLSTGQVELEVFCCKKGQTYNLSSRGYVWSGKLLQSFRFGEDKDSIGSDDSSKEHTITVIFTEPGEFLLSACARLVSSTESERSEQVWWARTAQSVKVNRGS